MSLLNPAQSVWVAKGPERVRVDFESVHLVVGDAAAGAITLSLRQSSEFRSSGGLERVEQVRHSGDGAESLFGQLSGHSVALNHPFSKPAALRGARHRCSPVGGSAYGIPKNRCTGWTGLPGPPDQSSTLSPTISPRSVSTVTSHGAAVTATAAAAVAVAAAAASRWHHILCGKVVVVPVSETNNFFLGGGATRRLPVLFITIYLK